MTITDVDPLEQQAEALANEIDEYQQGPGFVKCIRRDILSALRQVRVDEAAYMLDKTRAERNEQALEIASLRDALAQVIRDNTALVAAARPFLDGLDDVPTPDIGYVVCVTAEEGDALRAEMPEGEATND